MTNNHKREAPKMKIMIVMRSTENLFNKSFYQQIQILLIRLSRKNSKMISRTQMEIKMRMKNSQIRRIRKNLKKGGQNLHLMFHQDNSRRL